MLDCLCQGVYNHHTRVNSYYLHMEFRKLNRRKCNPLTSSKPLPFQLMNINNDYSGRVSRNSKRYFVGNKIR